MYQHEALPGHNQSGGGRERIATRRACAPSVRKPSKPVGEEGGLVTRVDSPERGEMLASRYRLEMPISGDPQNGHMVWRGSDSLLNRPVEIEVRVPGGEAAKEMISAAVAAGRVEHPNVVGVYDAVDEGERAFVVREWVDGLTLAEAVAEGPLEPTRAAQLARAVADAVAAIHATEMAHGNITPDAIMVSDDGEITLSQVRMTPGAPLDQDLRALGGLLYAALTARWPREATPGADPLLSGTSPTPTHLPDAFYVDGKLCSPRQLRAGMPPYLDALTMDLLDSGVSTPSAAELAAELRRYDIADPDLGPLTAFEPVPAGIRPSWKRYGIPIVGIACIIVVGLIVAFGGFGDLGSSNYPLSDDPTKRKPLVPGDQLLEPRGASILDPDGDGTELSGANKTIDGDADTQWEPADYKTANFGGTKKGMGVVLDLGKSVSISKVSIALSAPGATLELRGSDRQGKTANDYPKIASAVRNAPAEVTFSLKDTQVRYVVVWITNLPKSRSGQYPYGVGVREIIANS